VVHPLTLDRGAERVVHVPVAAVDRGGGQPGAGLDQSGHVAQRRAEVGAGVRGGRLVGGGTQRGGGGEGGHGLGRRRVRVHLAQGRRDRALGRVAGQRELVDRGHRHGRG